MLSVTSGSRSSPPPTLHRAGSRSGGEPKHANGEPQRSLAASPSIEETSLSQVALIHLPLCPEHLATGAESQKMHKTEKEVYGVKRTDEEDCKLSTVPELPEFSSPPSQTLKSNQDLTNYRNGSFTNSVSFLFFCPLFLFLNYKKAFLKLYLNCKKQFSKLRYLYLLLLAFTYIIF